MTDSMFDGPLPDVDLAPLPASVPAPVRAKASDAEQAVLLLNRIAPGAFFSERERVAALGLEAYLEEQLAPEAIDDSAIDAVIAQALPTLAMSRAELLARGREMGGPQAIGRELVVAQLLRSLYSRRPLLEAMVGFWSDVLNIQSSSAILAIYKALDDREVVRAHALGRFRDLLGASAKSPAMLVYLDNASNGRSGINENYARELMELHTLGVDGGYGEDDVVDVARALSGWSIHPTFHVFQFRPSWHDTGAKRVLGVDLPAGRGIEDGEQVLDILAAHPSTARHLATRLVRRFFADRPSAALVDAAAQAFLGSGGDIRAMLRALFRHPAAREAAPAKFKRPQEYVLSAMRVIGAQLEGNGVRVLLETLTRLAHVPFQWPAPNGYPDAAGYWLNSNAMLNRWNFAFDLTRPGGAFRIQWDALLQGVTTLPALVERLAALIGLAPLSGGARSLWLKTAMQLGGGQFSTANRNAVAGTLAALMLGSDVFQRR